MTQTTRVVTRDGLGVRVIRTARIEVTSGPDRGLRTEVSRPLCRVGTHASNDLVLGDDTVSKHHLELDLVDDGWCIRDLGSSNGSWLGDVSIREIVVRNDVTLRLANTTVRLRLDAGEAELAASPGTSFGGAVGRSPVMRELFAQLAVVAASDVSLLLDGETGVGKELLAESVHEQSPRRSGPFVVVDCTALASDLFESELFGHVKGAFTGADVDRLGLLESANGGTIFLDEIGELPSPLQAKLLGALERRHIRRIGDNRTRPLDVRVIAATHRDLARALNDGSFRADLFYRIAGVRLRVPSLRERLEDIPLLVEHFAGAQLSAIAIARLVAQPWPGNVRELRNAIERALAVAAPVEGDPAPNALPFTDARQLFLDGFDRQYLVEILAAAGGNVTAAARRAGVERRYFYRLMRRLQIGRDADSGSR